MEKWKIGWGISNLCNMRCGFCYSRKARQEPDFHDNIREGLRLIRENKDQIESINFGTGEPALVPEMFDLCEEFDWIPISMKNDWTTIYGAGVTHK